MRASWGANTRLGPTPMGACWERDATCTRRVSSVPWSWAASLTLSYSLIPQVFPASHPVAFLPCSVKDLLMGLQRPIWPQGRAVGHLMDIRSLVLFCFVCLFVGRGCPSRDTRPGDAEVVCDVPTWQIRSASDWGKHKNEGFACG